MCWGFLLTEAATRLSQEVNPYYLHPIIPTQTMNPALLRLTYTNATAAYEFKGRLFIYSEFQARSVFEEGNRTRKYFSLVPVRNSQLKGTRIIVSDQCGQGRGFRYQRRKAVDFDRFHFTMEVNYSLEPASAFLSKRYRRVIPVARLVQSTFSHFKSTLCQVKHSPEENKGKRNQQAHHEWFWWKITPVMDVH